MQFLNYKKQNVFTTLLQLLNVRHTNAYAVRCFNEHPHKNNLLGLSQMLSDFGVENGGTIIKDKANDIFKIEIPFVAHVGGDFVVIDNVTSDKVGYFWNGLHFNVVLSSFIDAWTGVALLVESSQSSIEPNYKENRKTELFHFIQKAILFFLFGLVLLIPFVEHSVYNNAGLLVTLGLNVLGGVVGYFLLQKQMHIQSKYVDKICSSFKKGDCNDVLESKASKLFGVIGWSEVGFGFFLANVFVLLFLPQYVYVVGVLNVCALPYSFWSIWYQKWRAKQWCPLCLAVMCLMWLIFFSNLLFGNIGIPNLSLFDLVIIVCVYLIPILFFNIFIPELGKSKKIEMVTQEINSLKANVDIFATFLKQQPSVGIDKSTSKIIFGNSEASILVTILTNPHCDPCAKMHSRVEKLLTKTNNLCIQYIFSSFEESLDVSNKFLIAAYSNTRIERTREIYSEWFDGGKLEKEVFFQRNNFDVENFDVEQEFLRHKLWRDETKIDTTPTVFVNGYRLPANYKIEDLEFFRSLDVDSK